MTNKNKLILGVVVLGVVAFFLMNKDKEKVFRPGTVQKEIDGKKYLKQDTRTDENKKKRAIIKINNLCKNYPVYKKDNIISELIKKTKTKISVKLSDNYKIAKWSQIISASKNNLFELLEIENG